jgi:hypothetical protein
MQLSKTEAARRVRSCIAVIDVTRAALNEIMQATNNSDLEPAGSVLEDARNLLDYYVKANEEKEG